MNYIRKALEALPGHWFNDGIEDGKGNYCGLGHLGLVVSEYKDPYAFWEHFEFVEVMNEVALAQYPERISSDMSLPFAAFNDHPETTEAEVVAVMEKAAVQWDERV